MTDSKNPKTFFDAMMNGASGANALPEVGKRMEAYWRAQAAAAEHMQSFFDHWCERRREAAEAAAECCARVFDGGGDIAAATEALTRWSQDEVDRLGKDANDQAEFAATIAGDAMNAMSNGSGKPAKLAANRVAKARSQSSEASDKR